MRTQRMRRHYSAYRSVGPVDFLLRKTSEMIRVPINLLRTIIVFAITTTLSTSVFAQSFVPGFEDVPLMPGLRVVPESGHFFESTAGRLIEIRASGAVASLAVERFYWETMPALGWRYRKDGSFERTNEVLLIESRRTNGNTIVTFRLFPRSK